MAVAAVSGASAHTYGNEKVLEKSSSLRGASGGEASTGFLFKYNM